VKKYTEAVGPQRLLLLILKDRGFNANLAVIETEFAVKPIGNSRDCFFVVAVNCPLLDQNAKSRPITAFFTQVNTALSSLQNHNLETA
jgi:hypothetical protein